MKALIFVLLLILTMLANEWNMTTTAALSFGCIGGMLISEVLRVCR